MMMKFRRLLKSIIYYIKGIYIKVNDENIFFLSAGIAFNGILCLLPALLLLTSVIGMFLNSSSLTMQKIDQLLNTAFPPQPYAQQIQSSLEGIIRDIIRYRSTFGYFGIGILLYASASMFSSIRHVLNTVYKLKSSKLVVITILENILLVIILGVLFVVANIFSWILLPMNELLKAIPDIGFIDMGSLMKSITFAASYLPALIMFFIINRFIPEKGISNKTAFIASMTTTTLWWIAGKGFSWYLTAFHSYSKLYGTYAFILVFLLWVYYSSVVFVIGVMIGQLFRERENIL
ncbi:MAG: YihY/virulence factor BrkB family protein [Ignavibacteriales bacterium]|nr:YihY/virulence factor BrkB family protein [Ignavibacteriales bacterium]